MVGMICPPPVGTGLTDLPNIGGRASGPPAPPVPASLYFLSKKCFFVYEEFIKFINHEKTTIVELAFEHRSSPNSVRFGNLKGIGFKSEHTQECKGYITTNLLLLSS